VDKEEPTKFEKISGFGIQTPNTDLIRLGGVLRFPSQFAPAEIVCVVSGCGRRCKF